MKLYLFVDYENMKFKLAKQNQGAGVPLVKSSAGCPSQSNLSTPDKGLVAGLAVLGAIVLAFLLYKLYRYCSAKPEPRTVVVPGGDIEDKPKNNPPRVPKDPHEHSVR